MKFRLLGIAALVATIGALVFLRPTGDEGYSQIEPGLYLGSSVEKPPPGTQAVVNLCGRQDTYQVGPTLWIPLYEGERPTLDILRRVVGFIDEQRRAGRQTYVHCMVGVNRSGSAVTAYVMQAHQLGRDEALTFVRRRRPEVQPDPTLMHLLAEWEQALRKNP
jgi:dual specificity phosphatase 12